MLSTQSSTNFGPAIAELEDLNLRYNALFVGERTVGARHEAGEMVLLDEMTLEDAVLNG
jgi:hypothetical protein